MMFFILCAYLYAQDSHSAHINELIAQAKALKLADSKEWKTLLHINKHKSEIISPYFFLTPNFKSSRNLAQDELEATIIAFYQALSQVAVPEAIKERRMKQIVEFKENNINLPTRSIEAADYHAICRFPARLAFLSSHLDFKNLPQLECAEFKAMYDYIAPTKASIVFPTAHINSPASMFGHTFLLLDSVFESRLLAFAINYQADADPNQVDAISFAFKGLFGFYTGSYSILPYYDKIEEYSNVETRDMWEYELNFTPEEIKRLYNHIWELSDAFSYYYFFHRNCSYNILWLLEVARKSLNLRKEFIYQVNPPETLFAFQKAGLINDIAYRPSKRSKLLSYEKVMDSHSISLAKSLSRGKATPPQSVLDDSKLSLQDKQYTLESALELSEYYYLNGKLKHEDYTQIAYDLASTRSKLGANTPPALNIHANPLEANQGLRITPLILANTQGIHPAIDFRIAYHDITDNDKGYLKGAQIEFMRILGYYDTSKTPKVAFSLYELNILSVASIAPRGKFFKPFSYRLETGFNRSFYDEHLHYFAAFGGGLSHQIGDVAYTYYFLEPTFFIDSFRRADFALNAVLGIVLQDNNRLKATLEYKLKTYSPTHFSHLFDTTFSINLKHNLALIARMQMLKNDTQNLTQPTSMLGVRLYF